MTLHDAMLEREAIANRPKHWVRAVTACNSHCLFCLDSDTPRNVYLPLDEVKAELQRGRDELDAWKVIISGGEASLHPEFPEMIRFAKAIGYGRVQTVTNGWRYADKSFYDACIDAGLGEITFSLHGHTEELHDHLTQHPGSFKRICKSILRAVRDPRRPIVNVDVVINKQNVGVLDKIVELAMRLGVTEFDLLHVIPQAAAFEYRDQLFYDVKDHMEVLHKVFRLNRHPRVVIWTNRFPVEFLEGLEDLIQDPHKMLDEVNGRRYQVRRYLDHGQPLDCRDPERCVHCFIEPFCTTMDRTVAAQREDAVDIWWGPEPLPFGARWQGLDRPAEVPDHPVALRWEGPLPALAEGSVVFADRAAQLDAWVDDFPAGVELVVELTADTANWLVDHADRLPAQVRIHQPSYEHMSEAAERDVRDPAGFFRALGRRLPVSGLPACLAPGMDLVEPFRALRADMFEDGRLKIRELARHHIKEGYAAKSIRCRDCPVNDRCDGAHINFLRDQGLKRLAPLEGAWAADAAAQLTARFPQPIARLHNGKPAEAVAPSLPGFAQPEGTVHDPLAVLAKEMEAKRAARRKAREERARAVARGD